MNRAKTPKKSKKTVYAFIDSQNLNVGVQKYGWKMNWVRLRKFLSEKYGVSKAYMFIGYVPEFEALYEQMHEAGYAVVLKPTFDMTRLPKTDDNQDSTAKTSDDNKEEKKPVKGNIDADLVLYAMKELPHYDQAVIVSGDGDFYCLIEYLDEQGRLLKLLTPNQQYSRLYNKYEKYVEQLGIYRRQLAYYPRSRSAQTTKK